MQLLGSDFQNGMVKRVRLCAKHRDDRYNRRRDVDFSIFRFFQDGGRPQSWICYVCIRTTHEGHLVIFIAVQNLVGIDEVVLIICMFSISRDWLENAYSRCIKMRA